jgi:hypothetical protein
MLAPYRFASVMQLDAHFRAQLAPTESPSCICRFSFGCLKPLAL